MSASIEADLTRYVRHWVIIRSAVSACGKKEVGGRIQRDCQGVRHKYTARTRVLLPLGINIT